MQPSSSRASVLLLLATIVACVEPAPPPPDLTVTSPQRGLVQSATGRVMVTGTARPGPSGSRITRVTVNETQAMVGADGSFTATVDVPAGAMLLKTVALSEDGGAASDARAVHVGEIRQVGTNIDRAVGVALSAETFAKMGAAAGPLIKSLDLMAMLAPMQPMASVGDSIANVKLSITKLSIGDIKITLTPVDGGLQLSAQFNQLNVGAKAAYGGYLVPDGTTSVSVTADQVTLGGILAITPAGTMGMTAKVASPTFRTTNMKLNASGIVGDILDLLDGTLDSTIQRLTSRSVEGALEPMINQALAALQGPREIDVMGKRIELIGAPSAIAFSRAGAIVTLNLQAKLVGTEMNPSYVFTPNGMPTLDPSKGIQLALADDLLNAMLAQVHALGLLNYKLQEDFGFFDVADLKLSLPPMISANTGDGKMRLVLGDMVATFTDQGKPFITAALNAQVDVELARGGTANEIALQFGKVDVFVNVIDGGDAQSELFGAASQGIGVQLDSLSELLVNVPIPTIAGVTLDNLSLRGDSGYAVVTGQVH